MVRIGIQLHTLESLDETISEKIRRVGQTDFEGVELASDEGDPDRIAADLREVDLEPVAAHVGLSVMETEYESVVDRYRTIGCSHLVVPYCDPDLFTSETGVAEAAERVSALAARLDDDGFTLSYHNHGFEFESLGDRTAFEAFVDELDDVVGLELDTGLAQHAGEDPVALLERYGERIELVHLTDTRLVSKRTSHVELNAGNVDLTACVDAAKRIGVEWLLYEHGLTTDPLESLEHGGRLLPHLTLS